MLHSEIAALIARVNSIVGNRIFSVHIQSDNNIIWIVFVRIIRVLPILTVKALSSLEILYKLGLWWGLDRRLEARDRRERFDRPSRWGNNVQKSTGTPQTSVYLNSLSLVFKHYFTIGKTCRERSHRCLTGLKQFYWNSPRWRDGQLCWINFNNISLLCSVIFRSCSGHNGQPGSRWNISLVNIPILIKLFSSLPWIP